MPPCLASPPVKEAAQCLSGFSIPRPAVLVLKSRGGASPQLLTSPPAALLSPQLACECYALLPSLGAGFAQGFKYRESWEQQVHCLVATLHRLLGTLYEGAEAGEWAPVTSAFRGRDGPLAISSPAAAGRPPLEQEVRRRGAPVSPGARWRPKFFL